MDVILAVVWKIIVLSNHKVSAEAQQDHDSQNTHNDIAYILHVYR